MFSIGMKERDATEVAMPEEDPEAFKALIDYLISDKVDVESPHLFGLMQLANKFQVRRLELICLHKLHGSVGAESAVPLLEASAAHAYNHPQLFGQCRRYFAQNGAEVKKAGGLEQLSDFPVAKGLLGDAIDRCEQLEEENRRLKRQRLQ